MITEMKTMLRIYVQLKEKEQSGKWSGEGKQTNKQKKTTWITPLLYREVKIEHLIIIIIVCQKYNTNIYGCTLLCLQMLNHETFI